jgi:hypothetical protein
LSGSTGPSALRYDEAKVTNVFDARYGFKSCEVDLDFDPILAALAGALTTVLGFYFGESAKGQNGQKP